MDGYAGTRYCPARIAGLKCEGIGEETKTLDEDCIRCCDKFREEVARHYREEDEKMWRKYMGYR